MNRATIASVQTLVNSIAGLVNEEGTLQVREGNRNTIIKIGYLRNMKGQSTTDAYHWLTAVRDGVILALKAVANGHGKAMLDQFCEVIPSDLVLLDLKPSELRAKEVKAIEKIDWYEYEYTTDQGQTAKAILVSDAALRACLTGIRGYSNFEDVGIPEPDEDADIMYIQEVLRRSEDNSFYHA